jgi:hypothetical protein
MSIFDIVLLFSAGFLSSVVNAIAGGGTFLTFGAMTLAGVPPIVANATSSVTQFPGYVTSALAYYTEIREDLREALKIGAPFAGRWPRRRADPARAVQPDLPADRAMAADRRNRICSPPGPGCGRNRSCPDHPMGAGDCSRSSSPRSMAVSSAPAWAS